MKQKKEEISFSDILSVFTPKLWLIAVTAIIFAGIFGVYSMFLKSDTYTSSSTTYVYRNTQNPSPNDLVMAEDMIESYSLFLSTDGALLEVISKVPDTYAQKSSLTTGAVRRAVRFSSKGNGVFVISVTTDSPELSFYLARGFEDVAFGTMMLKVQNALPMASFQAPMPASAPNGKGTVKNAAIGFVLGAAASAIVVFAASFFDSTIRSKKKIEDNLNIPLLGVIPVFNNSDKSEKGV